METFEFELMTCAALEIHFMAWLQNQGLCPCEVCRYPNFDESRGNELAREIRDRILQNLNWTVLGMRREFYESKVAEQLHLRN